MESKVFTVILAIVISISGLAYAQDTQNTASAGITPDNAFYGLDVFFDDLSLTFTFDATAKAEKALEIANERLLEVKAMALKTDLLSAEKAKAEFEKNINVAKKSSEAVTKSDGERELESKIAIEKKATVLESTADEVAEEVKFKNEISSVPAETKQNVASIVDYTSDSAASAKAKIIEEKEKVMARIMNEKGKSAAEVSTESKIIEDRTGVTEIKKDKAESALLSASNSINEALRIFKELYGFDAYETKDVANAIIENPDTDVVPESISGIVAESTKRATERAGHVSDDVIDEVSASAVLEKTTASFSGLTTTNVAPSKTVKQVKEEVKKTVVDDNNAKAAAVLINNAIKHYASAKSSFNDGDYGSAYGNAIAANKLADNAIKKMLEKPEFSRMLNFEVVAGGINGISAKGEFVINDAVEFKEKWKGWFGNDNVPEIEFIKQTAVVVFAGGKPTGGYGVEIKSIIETSEKVTIKVREISPDPDDMVIQTSTYPFIIVKSEKFTKPAEFLFITKQNTPTEIKDDGPEKSEEGETADVEDDSSRISRLIIKMDEDNGKTRVSIRKGSANYDFVISTTNAIEIVNLIKQKTGLTDNELNSAEGISAGLGSSGGGGSTSVPGA